MKKKESRFPKEYIGAGIGIFAVLTAVWIWVMIMVEEKLALSIFLLPIILASGILTILGSIWKITYGKETFTYRNYFGKRKTYRYDEVEVRYVSLNKTEYFKDGKKILTVAYYITNESLLEKLIDKAKSKKNVGGKAVGEEERDERNVVTKQPLMVLVFGSIFLICGAVMVVGAFLGFILPEDDPVWLGYVFLAIGVPALLAGLYFLVQFLFRRVYYHEETFTIRYFIGFKRTYRYDETFAAMHNPLKTVFYHNGRRILTIRYFSTYPDELYVRIRNAKKIVDSDS